MWIPRPRRMGHHETEWPAASMSGHIARARALRFFCTDRLQRWSRANHRVVSTRAITRIIATGSRVLTRTPASNTPSRRTHSLVNDVIIVGGGPAGLHAGLRLAEAGHTVVLFEEHADIGEPVHCTGVLARDAFDVFGLPADAVLNELATVRFFAPSGEMVEHSTPDVQAVVIDRTLFDRQLSERAMRAGVIIHRARVTSVDIEPHGVRVAAGNTQTMARVILL